MIIAEITIDLAKYIKDKSDRGGCILLERSFGAKAANDLIANFSVSVVKK